MQNPTNTPQSNPFLRTTKPGSFGASLANLFGTNGRGLSFRAQGGQQPNQPAPQTPAPAAGPKPAQQTTGNNPFKTPTPMARQPQQQGQMQGQGQQPQTSLNDIYNQTVNAATGQPFQNVASLEKTQGDLSSKFKDAEAALTTDPGGTASLYQGRQGALKNAAATQLSGQADILNANVNARNLALTGLNQAFTQGAPKFFGPTDTAYSPTQSIDQINQAGGGIPGRVQRATAIGNLGSQYTQLTNQQQGNANFQSIGNLLANKIPGASTPIAAINGLTQNVLDQFSSQDMAQFKAYLNALAAQDPAQGEAIKEITAKGAIKGKDFNAIKAFLQSVNTTQGAQIGNTQGTINNLQNTITGGGGGGTPATGGANGGGWL